VQSTLDVRVPETGPLRIARHAARQ
jgi:hypothetical protein